MKLTKRGKIVRAIVIAIAILFVISVADKATTPEKCKTNPSSTVCKELFYPN